MIQVDFNILNQKGSPALYQDTFANRPAASLAGRIFLATNTGNLYRDTGTTWVQIATGGGPGVTPGIDDVLAVGQKFTAARDIDCDNRDFLIQNAKTFIVENQSGNPFFEQSGSIVRFGDLSNAGNKLKFLLDDFNQVIKTTFNNNDDGIRIDVVTKDYRFGCIDNGNQTNIGINDTVQYLTGLTNGFQWGFECDFTNGTYKYGSLTAGGNTNIFIQNGSFIKTQFSNIDIGLKLDYPNSSYYLGDYNNISNGFSLLVNDGAPEMGFWNANSNIYQGLYVQPAIVNLCDFNNVSNGIFLTINDPNYEIFTGYAGLSNGLLFNYLTSGGGPFYKFGDFDYRNGSGAGSIVISGGNADIRFNTQSLSFNDNTTGSLVQGTSGSSSGLHLKVTINGANYVIELKNP